MHCEVAYGMQWYVQWYDDVSLHRKHSRNFEPQLTTKLAASHLDMEFLVSGCTYS